MLMAEKGLLALSLSGVSKAFGGLCAVDGVSLDVTPGERRAIIGPNGAGKTTLFSLISGEQPPTDGRITLFGRDVTRLPPLSRSPGLFERARSALEAGGLAGKDGETVRNPSHGEQRQLEIALALA